MKDKVYLPTIWSADFGYTCFIVLGNVSQYLYKVFQNPLCRLFLEVILFIFQTDIKFFFCFLNFKSKIILCSFRSDWNLFQLKRTVLYHIFFKILICKNTVKQRLSLVQRIHRILLVFKHFTEFCRQFGYEFSHLLISVDPAVYRKKVYKHSQHLLNLWMITTTYSSSHASHICIFIFSV